MKKYPVTEIFGPTVQGEGEHQGKPAYFIRFGGCDYRCEWCDTPHAVLPQAVRAAERLDAFEIVERLRSLPPGPGWVVITGGNPALHELGALVNALQEHNYKVSVETQGSRWKEWLRDCDSICVSPKPPSSGMADTMLAHYCIDERPMGRFQSHSLKNLARVRYDAPDYDIEMGKWLKAWADAGPSARARLRKQMRTYLALDCYYTARLWPDLKNEIMLTGVSRSIAL